MSGERGHGRRLLLKYCPGIFLTDWCHVELLLKQNRQHTLTDVTEQWQSHSNVLLFSPLLSPDTQEHANRAALAVKVTYQPIGPPIITMADAISQESFFPDPASLTVGDAQGQNTMHTYACALS